MFEQEISRVPRIDPHLHSWEHDLVENPVLHGLGPKVMH